MNNPICLETGSTESYCSIPVSQPNNSSYVTVKNCIPIPCSSDQIASPNCKCAYPYTGTLSFRAPSFSDLRNTTYYQALEKSLLSFFQSYTVHVDSVSLSNPHKDSAEYLDITLQVFPYGRDRFSRTEISDIGFAFSNQTYKPPKYFGPFFFIAEGYESYAGDSLNMAKADFWNFGQSLNSLNNCPYFSLHIDLGIGVPTSSNKSSKLSIGIIIGAAAGGSAFLLLLLLAGLYALRQKRRAERATELSHPFGKNTLFLS